MTDIQSKKQEILHGVYKSKDGLSWNELSYDLNELIEIVTEEAILKFNQWLEENHSSSKIHDITVQDYLKYNVKRK